MTFTKIDAGSADGKRGYQIFGVSLTHKGVLAMRGTSPEKLAGRLAVFKRDGDKGVTLVDMQRVMHKTEAARILGASSEYLDMCVTNGHERQAVLSFLQGVAGAAAVLPMMPSMASVAAAAAATQEETPQEETVQEVAQEVAQETVQEETVQEEAPQEVAVQETVQEDTVQEPDAAELLEVQEAEDAGETAEEELSETAAPKTRKRR
jgi:hypothetical protein